MSGFEWITVLHVLGAFLICGGAGVGMAAGITMPRSDSVRVIKALSHVAHRSAFIVTLPGSLLVLATGAWFVVEYQAFELNEFWLWSSFVLWGVAAVLDHGVLGPHLGRLHRDASRLEADGVEESAALQQAAGAPRGAIAGSVLVLLMVVFLYLMVAQPGG